MTHEVKIHGAFLQVGNNTIHIDKISLVAVGDADNSAKVKIRYCVDTEEWWSSYTCDDRADANKLYERILSALELAV